MRFAKRIYKKSDFAVSDALIDCLAGFLPLIAKKTCI